jgi:hypothetical protein
MTKVLADNGNWTITGNGNSPTSLRTGPFGPRISAQFGAAQMAMPTDPEQRHAVWRAFSLAAATPVDGS